MDDIRLNDTTLAPCPFCGSTNLSHYVVEGRDNHSVECLECLASSACKTSSVSALAAWNRRAQASAPQGAGPELSPEFTDTARAALLWVLWHHQGGSSPVGQPIRFALGMGQHEHLNQHQLREAKRWGARHPVSPSVWARAVRPLTDEQVAEACGWKAGMGCKPLPRELRIARAIEAAHGITGAPNA